MGQWWLLGAYLSVCPLLLTLLLCGDRPIFRGTFVERAHDFVTGGCCDFFQRLVGLCCGAKGRNACAAAETYCCEKPNPALQLFYLGILGGCYFTLTFTSLQYIPGPFISAYHRYTGPVAASVGLCLFLLTSFTDAGTIDKSTVKSHVGVYPFDNVLYEKKTCPTCDVVRPARSKHCSICNKCVARFDHHCAWMNNCIGEGNLRYFLSFLGWHVILLWYGVWVLTMILAGQLEERGVVRAIRWYIGRPATFHDIYPHVVQWLLAYYSTQVLLLIFMLVISLLLLGFFGYHMNLVVYNTTTNETYKWDRLRHWQAEVEADKQTSEVKDAASTEPSHQSGGKCGWFRCSSCWASTPKSEEKNIYDRGIWKNFVEVFNPRGFKRSVKNVNRKKQ
ncbi:hypothetical protein M758_10G135500 [Ceratodon purpureus]|nr:hypothetical protein M758_10G135500 [Ceratodon purpureus]